MLMNGEDNPGEVRVGGGGAESAGLKVPSHLIGQQVEQNAFNLLLFL